MIHLEVMAFGITRDIVGQTLFQVDLPTGSSVGDLRTHLLATYPDLAKLTSLLIAVEQEYGDAERILTGGEEIALIPPVSGG